MTKGERFGMIFATAVLVPAIFITFISWQLADGPASSFALIVFLAAAIGVRWYREYAAQQR